jgi:chorismate lyase / 3-hydroxybenzoate synthase
MNQPLPIAPAIPRLQIDYLPPSALQAALARTDTLAAFGFRAGDAAPASTDPRYLQVGLQPHGQDWIEVWRGAGPVAHGRDGDLAWADDGALAFAALQVREDDHGGLEAASEYAYRRMGEHLQRSGFPHQLRIWNYLDAITDGAGDDERYRRFCVGRARGIGTIEVPRLPAATAIGRVDGVRVLQVYWLAARVPGRPLENPRQVSAYRYPRQYGPQSPSFARAMLPPPGSALPLLLSGTASVVGHATRHPGQLLAQCDETFANFDALIDSARQQHPALPPRFDAGSRLKTYVSAAADLETVAQALAQRLDPQVPRLLLHAVVCRSDLMMEIDGSHG